MNICRQLLFIFISFQLSMIVVMAQEKFDLVTFTAPKDWQKEIGPAGDAVRFSKEDPAKNGFALITIFKAIPADTESKTNFDAAWEELVHKTLNASSPQMSPVKTQNGWDVQTGLSKFQKEDLGGAALLITASADNKMINILLVTNSDAFQNEVITFLESLKFPTRTKSGESAAYAGKMSGKPELWLNRRLSSNNAFDPASPLRTITDIYAIYPNGDYFPNVPFQGLLSLDRSYQTESWGKFSIQGNKGTFKNKYDEITVTKLSGIFMQKDGYSSGFHRFLPVDGLRIDGSYTHVSSEWGKDPKMDHLSGSGCQFVISFSKDGTFDDKGIFSTNKNNCTGGRGTYSIDNFTITFRYSDGRVVYRLFAASPTRDPAKNDDTIYIGHTAHYKRKQ